MVRKVALGCKWLLVLFPVAHRKAIYHLYRPDSACLICYIPPHQQAICNPQYSDSYQKDPPPSSSSVDGSVVVTEGRRCWNGKVSAGCVLIMVVFRQTGAVYVYVLSMWSLLFVGFQFAQSLVCCLQRIDLRKRGPG